MRNNYPHDAEMRKKIETVLKLIKNWSIDDAERVLSEIFSYLFDESCKAQEVKVKFGKLHKIITHELGGGCALSFGDHFSTLNNTVAVMEPYGITIDQLRELITFCDKKELECAIDGNSPHFVGRTVRIQIWKKK